MSDASTHVHRSRDGGAGPVRPGPKGHEDIR